MKTEQAKNSLEMLNGVFQPEDAKEFVNLYFEDTIRFYKVLQLKLWVHNHNANTNVYDQMIKGLKKQKIEILATINRAEQLNKEISFSGQFKANVVEKNAA